MPNHDGYLPDHIEDVHRLITRAEKKNEEMSAFMDKLEQAVEKLRGTIERALKLNDQRAIQLAQEALDQISEIKENLAAVQELMDQSQDIIDTSKKEKGRAEAAFDREVESRLEGLE